MIRAFKFCFIIIAAISFSSCKKIFKDAVIPTYIHIPSASLSVDFSTEGSESHNITDAWIYVDDQFIGCYELPATFPVITEDGSHNITISAGIKENGISATRTIYPMFTLYQETVQLKADSITSITPVHEYFEGANFPWLEGFESGGETWIKSTTSDTNMLVVQTEEYVLEGLASGKIHLNDSMSFFEIKTIEDLDLPKSGTPVYLELDHRGVFSPDDSLESHYLAVGIVAYTSATIEQSAPIIWLNCKKDWAKTYINLTSAISSHPGALYYKVYMGATRSDYNTEVEIYLDNIKLVHL